MILVREARVRKVRKAQEVQTFNRFKRSGMLKEAFRRYKMRLCETCSSHSLFYRLRRLNKNFPISYRCLLNSDTAVERLPDCSGTGAGWGMAPGRGCAGTAESGNLSRVVSLQPIAPKSYYSSLYTSFGHS